MMDESKKKCFSSGYRCPHCGRSMMVGCGNYHTRQRYLYKGCKKTFTDLTAPALHFIHDKEKFFYVAKLMLSGTTLSKIEEELGTNIATAFSWGHKGLGYLKNIEDDSLSEIVESDGTFLLRSKRGTNNIDRKSRKRGGKSQKRSLSSDQVCKVAARDKKARNISDIATLNCSTADKINKLLGNRPSKKSILLTKRYPSFERFVKNKVLSYINLDLSKGRRVIKGIYHMQNVNS